jgi:hypothetical protein
MDTPGGLIERPPQRIYTPTFWPLHRLLHLCAQEQPYDLTFWQAVPGAFTYSPDGTLQAVAVRNATKERAYGFIPFLPNPVTAHEDTAYAFDCALWFGERGDGLATDALQVLQDAPLAPWATDTWQLLASRAKQIVTVDLPDVEVMAVKPASRGEGLIVRLGALVPLHETIQVRIRGHTVSQAWLCDARERDIEPISIRYGAANPRMDTTITTVRLLV